MNLGLTSEELALAASQLIAQTNSGKTEWFRWHDSEEYATTTSTFVFYVKSVDEDDSAPFRFEVWRKGRPVGEDTPPNIKVGELTTIPGKEAANSTLRNLYTTAKLSALNMKNLKEDLFKELGAP